MASWQSNQCRWTQPDGAMLHGQCWTPRSEPRALILALHGAGAHSGYFSSWAERFAAEGVCFLACDLRGHGQSSGRRGHARLRTLKADARMILRHARRQLGAVPVVLLGHSMGGALALRLMMEGILDVGGAILLAPWLRLAAPPPRLLTVTARLLAGVTPCLTVPTGVSREQLRSDGSPRDDDPLAHGRISIGLFADMEAAGRRMAASPYLGQAPLLMMQGMDDRLVSRQAFRDFARANASRVQHREWVGIRHDVVNDAGSQAACAYAIAWLREAVW